MVNVVERYDKEEEFDLVRMVESAYMEILLRDKYVPKSSEIKDEIQTGCYDLIYGKECVSIISEDFITSVLMMKKHVHKSKGEVYFDAQVKLIPNLYEELEGDYIALP